MIATSTCSSPHQLRQRLMSRQAPQVADISQGVFHFVLKPSFSESLYKYSVATDSKGNLLQMTVHSFSVAIEAWMAAFLHL